MPVRIFRLSHAANINLPEGKGLKKRKQ